MDELNIDRLYNQEAEAEVIGGIICRGRQALDEVPELKPEHFYNFKMATAFRAAQALAEVGQDPNLVTIEDWIRANQPEAFDPELLMFIHGNTGYGRVAHCAASIIERYRAREAYRQAQEFAGQLMASRGYGANEAIANFARQLDEMALSTEDNEATFDTLELMRIGIQEFDRRYRNQGALVGLETGLRSLDELMMGLQKGSLYIMAGRPGMGKTAVSMTIAENIADRYQDGAVLVFNLEMSKEQLALRALASVAEVSLKDLQKGSDDSGQNWTKLNNGLGKSMGRKMFTDVRATLSIAQIRAKARQIKNKHGLNLVVIDYLQLIDESGRKFKDDTARVTWLSRQCKILAKELDVPLIVLSQLSRECEKRSDKRPTLSDLRDSGAIEQDADAVIFNYRHGYYTKDNTDDMLELIVAKQRMGETGTAYACFQGAYSKAVDVAEAYVDAIWRKRNPPPVQGKQGGRKL
jgi:replicative DNA helicase|nr:MAG TPA: DnaB-like replicative helicase [Caudoviricetes sp.]